MKKKNLVLSIPMALAVLTLLSKEGYSSSRVDALLKIPNGYEAGRADATYGTYSSVFADSARTLQARLSNLENKAMGLSKISTEAPWRQAEVIFLLEQALIRLHLDIVNAPENRLSTFERDAMTLQSVRTYQAIRIQGERIFEDMVRFIDVKIPGPNGLQFRQDLSDVSDSLYLPNHRSDQPLTEEERMRLYTEKVAEYEKKGGSIAEVKPLNRALLTQMGGYTRVEYVERPDGTIYVTEGNAGHVLLAAGKESKSAGQIIFLKARDGKFSMLIVSNSSGNFKPDMLSALYTAKKLGEMTDLDMSRILLTKGEPVSTQAVKVYGKGAALAKTEIDARVARLNQMDLRLREETKPSVYRQLSCNSLFKF